MRIALRSPTLRLLLRGLCCLGLVLALSATPADSTSVHYVGNEPHAPTADTNFNESVYVNGFELDRRLGL